nr:transglutaminase domain-containing protein [candidate division Zixibacteria bacterium]
MTGRLYLGLNVIIVGLTLIISSCTRTSPCPEDVSGVLSDAGDNAAQLRQVLEHYKTDPDTLKLAAAHFLIGNMQGHCYVTYYLHDSTDQEIDLDVLSFETYDKLLETLDSLESEKGTLDFDRDTLIYDKDIITADYLINQIDLAFEAWRHKPWAGNLSFNNFCNYVLPYRGSNEPLEDWRRYFMEKYADIESRMKDSTDPIEAAAIINNDIRAWFRFDRRFYLHPTDLGLKEMLDHKMGRCEDMTNITIYAFRANGLAVTSDYTPYWANAGNNHAWNAIVTADGRVIPFMGAESNPGDYHLAYKLAKVYRKTFAEQKDNLTFQTKKQEAVPGWLAGKSYLDVTRDYIPVVNYTFLFDETAPDSIDIAYICVFNSGEWKAIDWARIEDSNGLNIAYFTDLGKDIIYLPGLYLDKSIVPCGAPVLLGDTTARFAADTINTVTLRLTETTTMEHAPSTDGVARVKLTPGVEYELLFWNNNEWQSFGKKTAGTGPLVFEKVPSGTLYWLVAEEKDREERIFYWNGTDARWL